MRKPVILVGLGRWGQVAGAGLVVAAALTGAAGGEGTARAEPTGFGRQGVLDIAWDQPLVAGTSVATNTGLSLIEPGPMALTPVGFQYYSFSDNGGSGTAFSLAPAVDYFVIDNLSIGGQLMLGILNSSPPAPQQGRTTTLFGIAPQVGYDFILSDTITFWPKLFFAFAGASTSNNGGSFNSGTLGVFLPFLFHIAPHFYLGVGPDLGGGGNGNNRPPKITTFGAMATVGGWFKLGGG
jgi:hypothetical protein